jgi:hypothetical protein
MTTSPPPPTIGPGRWVRSFPRAVRDLGAGTTRCSSALVGSSIRLPDGQVFDVFRHTRKAVAAWGADGGAAVLVPRFHLEVLRPRRRRLHALFRVVCIVTTPFFVGLDGFRSKLWMVDPETGDFAGVYEWDDEATARAYADGLSRILRAISTPGSVSYEVVPYATLGDFLERCASGRTAPRAGTSGRGERAEVGATVPGSTSRPFPPD